MIPSCRFPSDWEPDAIVLGKGPSAQCRAPILKRFPRALLVTLNHAIRWGDRRPQTWAHFVDREAMEESLLYVRTFASALLLPTVMNENSHRSRRPIAAYLLNIKIPCTLYNRDEAGLKFFSVEGAVGALGILRHRKILLCGVDGGIGYAPGLEDVAHRHLENGRPSYDDQWSQLEKITAKFKLEVYRAPVD